MGRRRRRTIVVAGLALLAAACAGLVGLDDYRGAAGTPGTDAAADAASDVRDGAVDRVETSCAVGRALVTAGHADFGGSCPGVTSGDCERAAHRYCAAKRCVTGWVVGTDASANSLTIMCVGSPAFLLDRNITTDSACPFCGPPRLESVACAAAADQACLTDFDASGYGPVDWGYDDAGSTRVACLPEQLVFRHEGLQGEFGQTCDPSRVPQAEKVDTICLQRDAAAGVGPVENGLGVSWILCVRR